MGSFRDITVDISEDIGKAIPNEISKTNAWLQYIPYIGQASQVLSASDNFFTAYGDTEGDLEVATKAGIQGYSSSSDPGRYGSGGDVNKDVWNTIGQVGNLFSFSKGSSTSGTSASVNTQNAMGVFDNPYLFG